MLSQFYDNDRITSKCFQKEKQNKTKNTKARLLRDTNTVSLLILQPALLGMTP